MKAVFEAPRRHPGDNPPRKILNRLSEVIATKQLELLDTYRGSSSKQERRRAEWALGLPAMARSDYLISLSSEPPFEYTPTLRIARRIVADFIAEDPATRSVLRDSVFFDSRESTAYEFELDMSRLLGQRSTPQEIALAAMYGEIIIVEC